MDVNISWLCETFLLPPRVNRWQYPVGVEECSADVSPLATDAHLVSDQTFECLWRSSEHHKCFPAVEPWCGCTSLLIHLTRVILLLSALFPVFQVPLHSKLCFHVVFCSWLCRATHEPSPTRLGVFSFFFFTVTCSSEENFCSSSAVRKLGAPSARAHTKQDTWCVWKVNFKVYSCCISN